MNNEDYSRIIFFFFFDLKKIKFDKLEQVCDKVFVFVNREEKAIPFVLVQQLQKLGESVQWIPVTGSNEKNSCHFLSFHLGVAHEQMEEDVEFALISEDPGFDGIIMHLNELGRNAVRVTGNKERSEHASDFNNINWSKKAEEERNVVVESVTAVTSEEVVADKLGKTNGERLVAKPKPSAVSPQSQQLSERIARETIKRLVMSGNRPAAIDALKSYILLQYNNVDVNRNIDLIIRKLEKTKEIEVKDKEVVYNF
ncbi:MAG: PIN domain-containing protein [Saprospiraceae bacterium]